MTDVSINFNDLLVEIANAGLNVNEIVNFVKQAESEANTYAKDYLENKQISDSQQKYNILNALEHSYVSGRLTQAGMPNLAKILGAAKEYIDYENGVPTPDNYRDSWNNREGRAAGEATSGLPNEKDALAQNLLAKMGDVNGNGQIDEGSELSTDLNGDLGEEDGVQEWVPPTYVPPLSDSSIFGGATAELLELAKAIADAAGGAANWLGSMMNNNNNGGNGNPNDSDGDGRSDAPPTDGAPALPDGTPDKQASPLVFDLDGDGVELYAAGAYGTYFDLKNSGQAVLTGWVAPDDGLLTLDINANGKIDNGNELFGSETVDGFSILKQYDSNNYMALHHAT